MKKGVMCFRFLSVFLPLLLFSFVSVLAQRKAVSGTVTDASNQPVSGASVTIKGKPATGVTTDANGNFSIDANTGDVLVFSSVGFQAREEKIGGQNLVNISLNTAVNSMNEV